MNPDMQGHNHGGKSHLFGMLGIGALVLVVPLGAGRSFRQGLPLAFFLACALMMVGMMFMMRGGNRQQRGNDVLDQRAPNDATDRGGPPRRGGIRYPTRRAVGAYQWGSAQGRQSGAGLHGHDRDRGEGVAELIQGAPGVA